ncbi:hypothetical protein FV242_31380 [Methylobacterium sp. WL64]|uniref:hypothetical protein n=1 Tax=Methylobacterium sp. WL64 TaxID=2603894 RepID=UPI0011C99F0C|nr:hypothetical protein [Methylobacterium sp. WL64]TXM97505.1 hypothetical protein FV242_31380 [Methylobacterium sp. WL64]
MQLTPRQIRARLDRAVADAGSNRALSRARGVTESQVSRCRLSGRNCPAALLAAAGMWRDAEGDVRDRSDRGPSRFRFIAVQASGEAGVAAAVATLGAALGQR